MEGALKLWIVIVAVGALNYLSRLSFIAFFASREMPPLLYRHEVRLVLRDAATQQTVYETSASNEDVWTDTPRIFGVLFDAALAGFPTPPAGPRQVRLPMPGK